MVLGLLFEKRDACQALVVTVQKTEVGVTDYLIRISTPKHSLLQANISAEDLGLRILARHVRLEHDGCIYQLMVSRYQGSKEVLEFTRDGEQLKLATDLLRIYKQPSKFKSFKTVIR